jgi:hypothetical protein
MSCENCEEMQKSNMTSYYRWKTANIEIRGCKQHLKEIFEVLNKEQKKLE